MGKSYRANKQRWSDGKGKDKSVQKPKQKMDKVTLGRKLKRQNQEPEDE